MEEPNADTESLETSRLLAEYEKQVYDLQQLLEISRSFCTMLELSNLIDSILYISMAQMRVSGAGIFIRRSIDTDVFVLDNNASGVNLDASTNYSISAESKLVETLSLLGKGLTIGELEDIIPGLMHR